MSTKKRSKKIPGWFANYALKQWLDGSPECEFDRFLSLYLSDDLP